MSNPETEKQIDTRQQRLREADTRRQVAEKARVEFDETTINPLKKHLNTKLVESVFSRAITLAEQQKRDQAIGMLADEIKKKKDEKDTAEEVKRLAEVKAQAEEEVRKLKEAEEEIAEEKLRKKALEEKETAEKE